MATGNGGRRCKVRMLLGCAALWGCSAVLAPASGEDLRRGGPDLGPNPGHIPMSPALQRRIETFFGVRPARPASRDARPPSAGRAAAPVRRAPATRADLVALGVGPEELERLRAARFAVTGEYPGGLARLQGPPGLTEADALAQLKDIAPAAVADRNHRYRLATGEEQPGAGDGAAPEPACAPDAAPLIALVDTGVDLRHAAVAAAVEHRETLRGPGRTAARTEHGTAVAARLVAALPDARLAVLDVFHRDRRDEVTDAFDLAAALVRAAEIGAAIANVSAVGPANAVVDRAGAEAAARGVLFVAAAGNDGPEAAPLYPAAYAWAVAVTAVDQAGEPWARAAAGPHIAFAAPGVQVPLPGGTGGQERLGSGTSFATPVVTAMLAAAGPARDHAAQVDRLARRARDSGEPGRDPVYGFGVVELDACVLRRQARPVALPVTPPRRDGPGRVALPRGGAATPN